MKTFIDPQEEFIIKIPKDWYFTVEQHNGGVNMQPFGFEPYEKRNSAFQISYKTINNKNKLSIEEQPKGKNDLLFIETEVDRMKSWITYIEGGKVLLITYVFDAAISVTQRNKELDIASESVKTLLILDNKTKQVILPKLRWERFLLSYAASIDLANRAYENGSNIELVVLLANKIDSVLRQSLILFNQLENNTEEIEVKLIFQKEKDRPIMEKKIYQKALTQKIIDQETYDHLVELYNIRNKVIHRYIISDLRSNDIIQLVLSYSKVHDKLGEYLVSLEQKQFKKQIGLYKGENPPDKEISDDMFSSLISNIRDKHGNRKLNDEITLELQ